MEFHAPASAKDIQSFLGVVNQSAKFSPRVAHLSKLLRDLLQKDAQWIWEAPQQEAFQALKDEFRRC